MLALLSADPHLNECRRGSARTFNPGRDEFRPVERMEQPHDWADDPRLVGLERSDEMPDDVVGELGHLGRELLRPILTEVSLPLLVKSVDLPHRSFLRHDDEGDRLGRATRGFRGPGEAIPNAFETDQSSNQANAAMRSFVPSRRWLQ